MSEIANLNIGEVRIGASNSIIRYVLLPFLKYFNSRYPDITVKLITGSTSRCLQNLKEGKLDFCLVRLPTDDKLLKSTKVFTVQDCFVAGEKYRHLADRDVSLEELVRYPLIVFPSHMSTRKSLDRFFESHKLTIQPVYEIGSREVLIDFAKAGLGISCLVKEFIQEELAEGSLVEIKLREPLPRIEFGIVQLRDVPLPGAATKLIETILGKVARDGIEPVLRCTASRDNVFPFNSSNGAVK